MTSFCWATHYLVSSEPNLLRSGANTNNGKLLETLEGQTKEFMSVAFSPDGQRIVSGSAGKTVKIWDASE